MRIVYLINNLNTGGAESLLFKLVQLSKVDNEILVITLKGVGPFGEKLRKIGVDVIDLNITKFNILYKFFKLIYIVKKNNPQVFHTWLYHSNLFGGTAAFFFPRVKLFWSLHHNDLSRKLNKKHTIIIAYLGAILSKYVCKKIVCVSESVINTHLKIGYKHDKLIVINNGIDCNYFKFDQYSRSNFINELNLNSDEKLIGFFCRFDNIKNWKGFLEACSDLFYRLKFEKFKIVMAGNNMDRCNLELSNYINKCGLDNNIHLLGIRDDMPFLLSSMDLIVNNSFSESFSLSLAEALACERVCISTINGDPCELLENIGIRKDFLSIQELSEVIYISLQKLPETFHDSKKLGRERILNLYNIEKTHQQYLNLYN